MKAIHANDKIYCTVNGGYNPFNYDHLPRTHIDTETARAALDFHIQKKQSYDETGRPIPEQYHLLRDDTNDFLPTRSIGKQFCPIQHRDVYDYVVNEVMPHVPDMKLETCGTLYGGSTGLMTFTIGDMFKVPGDKSPNEMRLFVSNPCNGVGSMIMGFTTVRLFCRNQIAAAKSDASKSGIWVKHTSGGAANVSGFIEVIGDQMIAAQAIRDQSAYLASIGVSAADAERCLDAIYPLWKLEEGSAAHSRMLNVRNEVMRQFEDGETAQSMDGKTGWSLFNSFTYPIFNPQKIGVKSDAADIDYQGMVGDRAAKVTRILNTVTEIVGR